MDNSTESKPFCLPKDLVPDFLNPMIYSLSGCRQLDLLYDRAASTSSSKEFISTILNEMQVSYSVNGAADIPVNGSLIIVANHPTGMLDGLLMLDWILKYRSDVKVLANQWLLKVPHLAPLFCGIKVIGNNRTSTNYTSFKKAVSWLNQGGVLLVFPAGEVSSFQLSSRCIVEAKWQTAVARAVQLTESPVLPVYINGKNAFSFHVAGVIHPFLRTALLAREFLKKQKADICLFGGSLVPNLVLKNISNRKGIMQYLKQKTLSLEDSAKLK